MTMIPGFTAESSLGLGRGTYVRYPPGGEKTSGIQAALVNSRVLDGWRRVFGYGDTGGGGTDGGVGCPTEPNVRKLYCEVERRKCSFGNSTACANVQRCC